MFLSYLVFSVHKELWLSVHVAIFFSDVKSRDNHKSVFCAQRIWLNVHVAIFFSDIKSRDDPIITNEQNLKVFAFLETEASIDSSEVFSIQCILSNVGRKY
jgi:hypothetical protein